MKNIFFMKRLGYLLYTKHLETSVSELGVKNTPWLQKKVSKCMITPWENESYLWKHSTIKEMFYLTYLKDWHLSLLYYSSVFKAWPHMQSEFSTKTAQRGRKSRPGNWGQRCWVVTWLKMGVKIYNLMITLHIKLKTISIWICNTSNTHLSEIMTILWEQKQKIP